MNRMLCGLALMLTVAVPDPAAAQSVVAPTETLRMPLSEVQRIPQAAVRRVEANLANRIGTWTGVRSCNDANRARDAFMATFNTWIGEQVTGNPQSLLVRVGTGNAPWWYENRRRNGVRSCKGGFHAAPVYAHLYAR
ncbi:MAG TPA: hypothetical protein VEZ48_03840 [Sphingomonadaceae bacterium]|nr:hypothetical protein [Sphingomonadaceae bacterium]